MSRHELAMRNRALAKKRHRQRQPRGLRVRSGGQQTRSHRQPQRIAAICPGGPACALFSTPALYALRTAYPQAHIATLTGLASETIMRDNREIDELTSLPFLDMPPEQINPRQLGDLPQTL